MFWINLQICLRRGRHWLSPNLLGDPNYYGRLGFRVEIAKGYNSPYSGDHFMAVPFGDFPKTGEIVYPKPFKLLDQRSENRT